MIAIVTIQELVAPTVMVSANGLICLALYNRLTAIVARLRTFYREEFDARARLGAMKPGQREGSVARQLETRLAALEEQSALVLRRARLIRAALMSLLTAVLAMLACSLVLGLASLHQPLQGLALGLFVLGVLAMASGVSLALVELWLALEPVVAEGEMFDAPPPAPDPFSFLDPEDHPHSG